MAIYSFYPVPEDKCFKTKLERDRYNAGVSDGRRSVLDWLYVVLKRGGKMGSGQLRRRESTIRSPEGLSPSEYKVRQAEKAERSRREAAEERERLDVMSRRNEANRNPPSGMSRPGKSPEER